VSFAAALPLAAALAAVLGGCLAAARWRPRPIRPLCLALACGADFGVTAFLLKLVPDTLPEGFSDRGAPGNRRRVNRAVTGPQQVAAFAAHPAC
jgi:hypothetical protein